MWSCLETNPSLSAVPCVWQRELGPHFPLFRAAFLERRPETARSYPCPRDCGCAHEVIRHAPGDIVAVCRCDPWNCDDIRLNAEDITPWQLSWSKFGRALCRALSLENKPADLGLFNTRQIGAWSAAAVPVILTIQSEARLFRHTLLELATRLQSPFIILAPTARLLAAPILELLASVKAGFFDLRSCVALASNGMLQPIRPPGEMFVRFTAQPAVEDQTVLQRAFALAKALETQTHLQPPSPLAVFTDYCLEGLNVSQVARKLHCSRGTVMNRLKLIRQRTGMDPDRLRKISPHIDRLEDQLTDPRAAHIYRQGLVQDPEEEDR